LHHGPDEIASALRTTANHAVIPPKRSNLLKLDRLSLRAFSTAVVRGRLRRGQSRHPRSQGM